VEKSHANPSAISTEQLQNPHDQGYSFKFVYTAKYPQIKGIENEKHQIVNGEPETC
jgi:hypothetical protein